MYSEECKTYRWQKAEYFRRSPPCLKSSLTPGNSNSLHHRLNSSWRWKEHKDRILLSEKFRNGYLLTRLEKRRNVLHEKYYTGLFFPAVTKGKVCFRPRLRAHVICYCRLKTTSFVFFILFFFYVFSREKILVTTSLMLNTDETLDEEDVSMIFYELSIQKSPL